MDEPDLDWLSFGNIEALCDEADDVFRSFVAARKCNGVEAAVRFFQRYTDLAGLIACETPTTLLECGRLCETAGALIAMRARGWAILSEHDELAMLGACHVNYQRLLWKHHVVWR